MNTRSYLKVITFSISLVLTFMIASLYASAKVEAIDDTGKELQENRHAIDSASVVEEEQHLSQNNATESEATEEQAPGNSQQISNADTATRAEFLDKQVKEDENPIGILASAGTKTKEIIEKQDNTEGDGKLPEKEAIENAPAADETISWEVANSEKGRIDNAISAGEIPKKYSTDSDTNEYMLDKVIVKDETTTHSLEMEIIRADELKYEIFNELNSTDDYDIICKWRTQTGSRLRDWYCVSGWMEKERARDMDNFFNAPEMVIPRSDRLLAIAFADRIPTLKKEMVDLAIKHPELATAMLRAKELRQLFEKKGYQGRIKKKKSTGLIVPGENDQAADEFVLWQAIFVDHLKGSTPDDTWARWDSWCRDKMKNKAYQALWARADKDQYVAKFKAYVNIIMSEK